MASGLKSSKTYTVGCVLPDITDPFFPGIMKVFQEKNVAERVSKQFLIPMEMMGNLKSNKSGH